MVKSMTAYARADKEEDGLSVEVELRSYNGRFLDTHLKVSHGYNRFEEKIRSTIAAKLVRGRVEGRIVIRDASDEAIAYEADVAKARAYGSALREAADAAGVSGGISLDQLLHVSGLVVPKETETDFEHHWTVVAACLEKALDDLDEMRSREGDFLAQDLLERLEAVEASLGVISEGAEGLSAVYHDRLMERISVLCGGAVEVDESRIAQEAALLADRSDISEEITRAKSHLVQFRSIMEGEEEAGRKLNFLLQEFNREFNTMGSKIGKADVAHVIVSVKSELEKMREQVQNIE
ncbi:MAG: YicC family protein [Desulfobacterales bacterium]|nr:YicC family protein [Desulfobacterales bacterium]